VYASTRAAEMELVDWSESDKQAFLRQQFTAQRTYYQQHYATASFQVVLRGDAMVGRLYVNRGPTEIRIIDIALLPEYRGGGIGTRLLRDVLGEATRERKVVTIHVERFNPALDWYLRLGFKPIEDRGVYVLMRWSADDQVKTAS
jgi:ribosomal protein S18 acetylase RimI-like enzyme